MGALGSGCATRTPISTPGWQGELLPKGRLVACLHRGRLQSFFGGDGGNGGDCGWARTAVTEGVQVERAL